MVCGEGDAGMGFKACKGAQGNRAFRKGEECVLVGQEHPADRSKEEYQEVREAEGSSSAMT